MGRNSGSIDALGQCQAAVDRRGKQAERFPRRNGYLSPTISQRTLAIARHLVDGWPNRTFGNSVVRTKKEEKQNFRVRFLHTRSRNRLILFNCPSSPSLVPRRLSFSWAYSIFRIAPPSNSGARFSVFLFIFNRFQQKGPKSPATGDHFSGHKSPLKSMVRFKFSTNKRKVFVLMF